MTTEEKYKLVRDDYGQVDLESHNTYDSAREFESEIGSFAELVVPGGSVLNIGGTLTECRYFADRGLRVTNLDVSPRIVEDVARDRRVDSLLGSIDSFAGRPEGGWNGVWACRSLFHIPLGELPKVLVSVREMMSPAGVMGTIFFVTDESEPVEQYITDEHSDLEGAVYYRVLYSEHGLKDMFCAAGFEIVKVYEVHDQDGDRGLYIECRKANGRSIMAG